MSIAEKDARLLATKIVERVRALGADIHRFGVSEDNEGLWFVGLIGGKFASARTGAGNFTYEQVARELVLSSLDRDFNRLTILPPDRDEVKRIATA